MSLNALAIVFAVLGASAELFGLAMVVREIKGDRDWARGGNPVATQQPRTATNESAADHAESAL